MPEIESVRLGQPIGRDSSSDLKDVLLIGGMGRTGSTLLSMILGQVSGFVAVGELRQIWSKGYLENRLCGCGLAFRKCEFWDAVGREAFGGWSALDVGDVLRTRLLLDRPWGIPLMTAAKLSSDLERRLSQYLAALSHLYRAISAVSGASVIVDSSKMPSHARILLKVPGLNVRLVHLVRDSRAVAFSAQRVVEMPSPDGPPAYLPRYTSAAASIRYLLYNLLMRTLSSNGTPYMFLRYEDLVADPRTSVQRVIRHAGHVVQPDQLSFLRNGQVRVGMNHVVDGNPVRFAQGSVKLRLDDEWRDRMSARDRRLVAALTFPQLLAYGYPITMHSGSDAWTSAGRS